MPKPIAAKGEGVSTTSNRLAASAPKSPYMAKTVAMARRKDSETVSFLQGEGLCADRRLGDPKTDHERDGRIHYNSVRLTS